MSDQIDRLGRNLACLAAIIIWVPLAIVWTVFAPLIAVLDVLGMAFQYEGYRSLEWTWCGVRLQANHKHVDAGGGRHP